MSQRCDEFGGFFKKDAVHKFCRTVLPFIVAFAVGLGLAIWYPENWRFGEFIRVLRDALLVAGLIGTFIELWSVSVLVDHASDQLSERLVGYGLPKAAQRVIHDLVHRTKRVYRDYRVTYRIERHATKEDYVVLRSTISYKVVNNGKGSESYSPELLEEGMYLPSVSALEFDECLFAEGTLRREVSENGVVSFAVDKTVSIAPSDAVASIETLDKEHCCSVRWDVALEMRRYYSSVIAFTGVTVNPVVEVQALPEVLEFYASLEDCLHAPGGKTWAYTRAFIGGQHIRVWWKPKDEGHE